MPGNVLSSSSVSSYARLRPTARRSTLAATAFLFAAVVCAAPTRASEELGCPDVRGAKPALLIDSPAQLEMISEHFRPWRKSAEQMRIVKAAGYVQKSGELRGLCCISTNYRARSGWRSLSERLQSLKFEPAIVDGEPREVFVNFAFMVRNGTDGVETRAAMNHLRSVDKHGLYYVAPQRLRKGSMWPEYKNRYGPVTVSIATLIDADGKVDMLNEERFDKADRLIKHLANEVKQACFIPGFADGKPVEMPYLEVFQRP